VIFLVGHLGEQIEERFGNGSNLGLSIAYSFDGPSLLGTAGAIRRALPLLSEAFFVLYGDSSLTCDYGAVEEAFLQRGLPGLMTVYRNAGKFDRSNVHYEAGRILEYEKRQPSAAMHHIDYGLGVFQRSVFEGLRDGSNVDLASVYRTLIDEKRLAAFEATERFYEIGSPEGLRDTAGYLRQTSLVRAQGPLRSAVFLDRDGVLNEAAIRNGRPYPPDSLEDMRIVANVRQSLTRLKNRGFLLFLVTNQPDVARGTQKRETVDAINTRLRETLPLDGALTCFHDDADGCGCRKPKPGLMTAAASEYGIDLKRSFLVGDRWRDIDAGANAGCRTILIDYGYDERPPHAKPDARVRSVEESVDWILLHSGKS
jgi:D-glycero-D-manno-heptose 1,7-bisphosphate phosphatase